ITTYIFFRNGVEEAEARFMIESTVKKLLSNRLSEHFDQGPRPLEYELTTQRDGTFAARISTLGIARHPAQLYESISCALLFVVLFLIWKKHGANLPTGRLFGIFLVVCFGLRFVYEFLKENQVSFEDGMTLNMGQILSIPLVIAGFFVLAWSYRNQKLNNKSVS